MYMAQCIVHTCHTMPINDDWYAIFASDTWYAYQHTANRGLISVIFSLDFVGFPFDSVINKAFETAFARLKDIQPFAYDKSSPSFLGNCVENCEHTKLNGKTVHLDGFLAIQWIVQ